MSSVLAARRYAVALLDLAIEKKVVESIVADMQLIGQTLSSSKELRLVLVSPIIKDDKKGAILTEVFKAKISNLTFRFMDILVRKGRSALLESTSKSFLNEYDKYAGIIRVEVTSAMALSPKQQKALKNSIESMTEKTAELSFHENSTIIGGLRFQVGDTIYDGSLSHKLEQLTDTFSIQ